MRLHEHPVNAAREAEGRPAVNSFWLSGCGVRRAEAANDAELDERLSVPALAEDWPAWGAAFDELDTMLASRAPTQLTLCGERGSVTYRARPASWWQRLAARLPGSRVAAHAWAEAL
jgi:hypothetical protein